MEMIANADQSVVMGLKLENTPKGPFLHLISLHSHIQILFNNINHFMAENLYTLCKTIDKKKIFFTCILCVSIS